MKRAIVGAKIYPVAGEAIAEGTILIEDGKIVAVEPGRSVPSDYQVEEAEGLVATPGLIDAHTHVGISEEGIGWEGEDYNETTDPITPHLRTIDGIYPVDEGFVDARRGGVTAVGIHPGSANVLGGQGAALKTYGRTVEEMALKAPVAIKGAFGENPKRVYSQQKKSPSTRMATAALLRQALVKAQNYRAKKAKGDGETDLVHEALLPLLAGEIPFFAHAHRADDIMTALRIAKEFGLRLVIQHGTEAHLVAEILASEGIPVVVGPSLTSRAKVELRKRTFKTPKVLAEAGVDFAIMTDHPVIPIQYLPVCVRLAIKEGLAFEIALKAVTLTPARLLGIEDRVGSLLPGKDADIVLWRGEPFLDTEVPERVYINGQDKTCQ
ncbi:MAG: amidohydrolase [Firmicutes bacterium]|nr:amidohydrolase [Bacillota bacterium]